MKTPHWLPLALSTLACTGENEEPSDSQSQETGETGETGDTGTEVDLSCPEDTPLGISTSTGCITGDDEGALEQWIGVPYAQPPVGDLRFARTVPVEPWTEPFEAEDFGEECLQWDTTDLGASLIGDEDCLTLNIFRPEETEEDAGLPILFFTHGGYHTEGAGSLDSYALVPQLAESAIVITHNYRLGPMGFIAHEDLTEEDEETHENGGTSGNQALFDTLTALQWVHENAAAMGGDPEEILVFGESAGGTSTCALLASPLAEGLFSAAMIQSATCGFLEWPLRELSGTDYTFSAEDYGDYIASELDCYGSDTLECLRELDSDDIMDTLAAYTFSPNFDQVFLTRPAREAFLDGDFNQVPVFAGFNKNEGVSFTSLMGVETEADLHAILTSYATDYGFGDVEPLTETYTSDTFGTPKKAFDAFYGDLIFACPTRSFLQAVSSHVETRAYFFTEAPDWLAYYPEIEDWGAFHFAEIAFVFGTTLEYYTAPEQALSETMQAAWVSTLDTPTVEGIGDWPLFEEGGGVSENGGTFVQYDSSATQVTDAVFQDRCDLLDSLGWQNY